MRVHPDPTAYYRLTNHFTGPSAPLSIYRDSTSEYVYLTTRTQDNMNPKDLASDLEKTITPYWQFFPVHGSSPPRYHILTEFHEQAKHSIFLALDVFNQDRAKPHLTRPGYYSGQYWSLTSWEGDEDSGMHDVKLTNDYSGEGLHLDTYANTKGGFLGDGDHTGQHWVLEKVKKPECDCLRETDGMGLVAPRRSLGDRAGLSGDWGFNVGVFAFGLGFGAAVVVAMAWVEILPLLLVGGLTLGSGVWLGQQVGVRG